MTDGESGRIMTRHCPSCGAPLSAGALEGLCPACLLQQGASTETATRGETRPFQPPGVDEVAKLFPQLEIIAFIGKGGMGAVYKARQPALDRFVALKILPPRVAGGPGFAERFVREARALAKLSHPNIVAVYEFGQVDGLPFLLMEFVDGLNLRALERSGRLAPREALKILPQICEALQFAHDEGVVHRDIKPENILLDKRGRVKIADFGIAKIMGADKAPVPVPARAPDDGGSKPPITEEGRIIGTPHYMAPEQVDKPQSVDHRADIFSLGVVFYEMLTGELPLGRFAPPSSRVNGGTVDVRLDEVVLRALEKEPEHRYQQASQVKTAVETIADGAGQSRPVIHPPPAQETTFLRRDPSRFSLAVMAGVVFVMVGLAVAIVSWSKQGLAGSRLTAPPGLVAWWAAEGNTYDSVGGLDGVPVNGVGFVAGKVGQAFSFDGITQYVANPAPAVSSVLDSYTIEFWAWPNAARASTPEAAQGINGVGDQRFVIAPIQMPGGSIAGTGVSVGTNGISVFELKDYYLPSLLVYDAPITGWTHVAVAYSNRVPSLYVNGVLVRTGLTSPVHSCPGTCLGGDGSGYGGYSGLLDEVSIYNRPLSDGEIQAIYDAGSAGKLPAPPAILGQPRDQIAPVGSTVSFSTGVGQGRALSYQWRVNGRKIRGATNATLTLASVQAGQSGRNYSVRITNPAGSTDSSNALLTVLLPGAGVPAPTGLVAWWAAEGNAADSSGTNDGSPVNGAGFDAGKVGQAFSFNGANQYIQVPDSSDWDFGTREFTIELWAKFAAAGASSTFVAHDEGPYEVNKWIFWLNHGLLQMHLNDSAHISADLGSGAFNPVLGAWYHLAVTRSGPVFSFYVNGALNSVATHAGAVPSASAALTIGATENHFFLDGEEDEIAIYNRALGQAEIQAIYDAGSGGKLSPQSRSRIAAARLPARMNVKFTRVEVPDGSHSIRLHFERDAGGSLGFVTTQGATRGPMNEMPATGLLGFRQGEWVGAGGGDVLEWELPPAFTGDVVQAAAGEVERSAHQWSSLVDGASLEFAHFRGSDGSIYVLFAHVSRKPDSLQ
jgi:predicted Ser/Thr protein kinase